MDMLASVSSAPVGRSQNAQSEAHISSVVRANDTAQQSQQIQKSSFTQSQESVDATGKGQRGSKETAPAKASDAKKSTTDTGSTATKGTAKTDHPVSRKGNSKKTGSTVQDDTAHDAQKPTTETILSGVPSLSTTPDATDVAAASADADGESNSAQPVTGMGGQGSGQGTDLGADSQAHVVSNGLMAAMSGDAELAAKVLEAARQAGSKSELKTAVAETAAQVADATPSKDGAAIGNAKSDKGATENVAAMPASVTVPVGAHAAMKQSGDELSQQAISQIQMKTSASGGVLKVDANKTDKDGTNGDGRSASQDSGNALSDLQAAQNAHATGAGSEAHASQAIFVAAQAEAKASTVPQATHGVTDATAYRADTSDSAGDEQFQGIGTTGMSGISAARLIQNMSGTEMRVGMHSSEFGEISIRTSVSQQQMQTQISVDHNELGNALSAHIPSVQAKMGSDYGLHATIEVNQGGASFTHDGGRSQNQHQQSPVRRIDSIGASTVLEHEQVSLSGAVYASSDSRLDIRA
jgi:hypothetical protein